MFLRKLYCYENNHYSQDIKINKQKTLLYGSYLHNSTPFFTIKSYICKYKHAYWLWTNGSIITTEIKRYKIAVTQRSAYPVYSTEKNAELLDLIVTTLSNSKSIVLDFTAAAAQH